MVGCAGDRFVADGFVHGKRLAADHRFIDFRIAFDHDAIDRDAIAGADQQAIALLHLRDGNFVRLIQIIEAQGDGGGEVEQLADGRASAVAGAGFEPVAEADEGEQAGRFVEIERGEFPPAGEIADEGDEAVEVSHGRAHGDEGVHVGCAMAQGGEGGFVEGGADVDDGDGAGDQGEPVEPCSVGEVGPVEDFDGEPKAKADDPAELPGAGMLVLVVKALLFGIGGGDGGVVEVGVIAGMLDGLGQLRRISFGWIEADAGPAGGEVDLGCLRTGNRFEGFFDVGDATGAGHAFDIEIDFSRVDCLGAVVVFMDMSHQPYCRAQRIKKAPRDGASVIQVLCALTYLAFLYLSGFFLNSSMQSLQQKAYVFPFQT